MSRPLGPCLVPGVVPGAAGSLPPAPPPPAFVYECPGHAADVLRQLDEQRRTAAGAGGLCDASVAVGGSRFPAHRAVLAACSDFFRAATVATAERQADGHTLSLPAEITVKGFEQILNFAYTGKLYLSQDSYEDIHHAASILRIRTLEDACFRFLEQKLGRADEQEPRKAQVCGLSKAIQGSCSPCFPRERVVSSSSSSGGSSGSNVCSGGQRKTDDREPSKAQACGLAGPTQASFHPCFPGEKNGGSRDGDGNVFSRGRRQSGDASPRISELFEHSDEEPSKRAETVTTGRLSPPETAHAFGPRGALSLLRCPLRDMDTSCRVIVSTIRTPNAGGGSGSHPNRDKMSTAERRSDVEVFEVKPGARFITAAPRTAAAAATAVVAATAPPCGAGSPAKAESLHSASDKRHPDVDTIPSPPLKRGWGSCEFGKLNSVSGISTGLWNDSQRTATVAAGDRRLSVLCPKYRRYQVACSNQDGATYQGMMSGWWASNEDKRKEVASDCTAMATRNAEPYQAESDCVRALPAPPSADTRDASPCHSALSDFPAQSGESEAMTLTTMAMARKRSEMRFLAHGGDRGCGGGSSGGAWHGRAVTSGAVCGRGFIGRLDMKRVEGESDGEHAEEEGNERDDDEEGERGDCRGGGIGTSSDLGGGMQAERGVGERFSNARSEDREGLVTSNARSSPVNLSMSCRSPTRRSASNTAPTSFTPPSSSSSSSSSSLLPASLSPRPPAAAAPFSSCPVLGPQMEAAAVFLQRSLGLRVSPTAIAAPSTPAQASPRSRLLLLQPPPSQLRATPPPPAAAPSCGDGGCAVYGDGGAFSSSGEESFSDESDSCASKPDCPEVSLPFPVAGVPEMARNEFQALLRRHALSAAQLELVHDVRRRSKNRMAARRCRKRKLDCINGLEGDIRKLVSERDRALRERELLTLEMAAVRQSCAGLYQTICREVRSSPEHVRLLGPYLPAAVDRPISDVSVPRSATATTSTTSTTTSTKYSPPTEVMSSVENDSRGVGSSSLTAAGGVVRPGSRGDGGGSGEDDDDGGGGNDGGDSGDGVATVMVEMRAMKWSAASEGGHGVRTPPGVGGKVAQPNVDSDTQEDHGKGNDDEFARLQISAL